MDFTSWGIQNAFCIAPHCSHARSSLHHILPAYCNSHSPHPTWSSPVYSLPPGRELSVKCESFSHRVTSLLTLCVFPMSPGIWNMQRSSETPKRVWGLLKAPVHWAASSFKNTSHLLLPLGLCTCCLLYLGILNSSTTSSLQVPLPHICVPMYVPFKSEFESLHQRMLPSWLVSYQHLLCSLRIPKTCPL